MSEYINCGSCGKKLKIWFSGFGALARHKENCPDGFKTIKNAKAAGVYCGTLLNGDTFGDEDDMSLDLDGRKVAEPVTP